MTQYNLQFYTEEIKISGVKLDPAFKARWVAALRSKTYKQGRGVLCNRQGEFCCLGVACEVEALPKRYDGYTEYTFPNDELSYRDCDVPHGWNGLTETVQGHLIALNDDCKASFEEIANIVEENL